MTFRDPTIRVLHNALRLRKLEVAETRRGIRLPLGREILPSGAQLEIYALKTSPNQVRARISNREKPDQVNPDVMQTVWQFLQTALMGVASIGQFSYLGERGGIHYHYARIQLSREASELADARREAEQAFQLLREVDAGDFRLAMDAIGLPRSSKLRLSFTRIYREAFDVRGLLAVIAREAAVLAATDECALLDQVQKNKKAAYLAGIVNMLWKAVSKERFRVMMEDMPN